MIYLSLKLLVMISEDWRCYVRRPKFENLPGGRSRTLLEARAFGYYDGSVSQIFNGWCCNNGIIKQTPNHWSTNFDHFLDIIGYHGNSIARWKGPSFWLLLLITQKRAPWPLILFHYWVWKLETVVCHLKPVFWQALQEFVVKSSKHNSESINHQLNFWLSLYLAGKNVEFYRINSQKQLLDKNFSSWGLLLKILQNPRSLVL